MFFIFVTLNNHIITIIKLLLFVMRSVCHFLSGARRLGLGVAVAAGIVVAQVAASGSADAEEAPSPAPASPPIRDFVYEQGTTEEPSLSPARRRLRRILCTVHGRCTHALYRASERAEHTCRRDSGDGLRSGSGLSISGRLRIRSSLCNGSSLRICSRLRICSGLGSGGLRIRSSLVGSGLRSGGLLSISLGLSVGSGLVSGGLRSTQT